jgi:hypothetical protein
MTSMRFDAFRELDRLVDQAVLTLTIPVSEANKPRKVQTGRSDEGQPVHPDSAQRQSVQA